MRRELLAVKSRASGVRKDVRTQTSPFEMTLEDSKDEILGECAPSRSGFIRMVLAR